MASRLKLENENGNIATIECNYRTDGNKTINIEDITTDEKLNNTLNEYPKKDEVTNIVVNENNENPKIVAKDTNLVRGKRWFDLSKHKMICKFDVESEYGKGNLQGIAVVDGYLYAHRNVKDSDNGINNYSPGEKGRIYKFDLNGNLILKTNDLDNVAHQGLSYFKDSTGQLQFVSSGGTPNEDNEIVIKNYKYEDITVYPNFGRHISIIKWDDSDTPEVNLYRVIDDYDSNNEKETIWYHALPYVDNETKKTIIVFSDIKTTRRKLVRIYNNIQTIIDGDYNNFEKEFIVTRNTDYASYYDFQGVAYKNGLIYMLFGSYDSSQIRNREIRVYTDEGSLVNVIKFMPNFINLSNYKYIEPEGIVFDGNDIYIGMHLKNNDDIYEEYLVKLDDGTNAILIKEDIPYSDYKSSDIDQFIGYGSWFTVWQWNESSLETKHVASLTDYGNLRIAGNYIGIMYDPTTGSNDFNKCINYDTTYGILNIRAWTDLATGGSGINLYHKDGSASNAGGIKFYKNGGNYIFTDLPTSDPNVAGAIWNDGGILKVSDG